MLRNSNQLQADIRELQLRERGSGGDVTTKVTSLVLPTTPPPAASAVNQIRNGDASHSVRTWFETTSTDDDENKECAHWYSHNAPVPAQTLYEINTYTTGSPNTALKFAGHAAYDTAQSDWSRSNGSMRLNGTQTIDAPFPANVAAPGRTEYVGLIAARISPYIQIPTACRMFGGVWDNTAGQNNWVRSANAFSVTARVVGIPSNTIERRYRVFARTDRGYDYLTTETVEPNAPDDASFVPNQIYVNLTWTQIPNTVSYYVYRYTPSTGEYLLIKEIGSGTNNYNDNNRRETAVTAYPTATDDRIKAYFATREGELINLAVDGVALRWDTITLPIKIPADYNQSLTTDKQWLRIGLTEPLNLRVTDAVTNSTATVTSDAAQFVAEHSGLTATISDGTNTLDTTVTYVADGEVTLSPAPTWTSANNVLTIYEGGFHGIYIDLVHASYQSGAVYAPYPEDLNRALQPAAAPNGSTQGGVGDGGNPGGGINCIHESELVQVFEGDSLVMKKASDVRLGDAVYSGNLTPNYVVQIAEAEADLWEIETANGWKKTCSSSHPMITSQMDTHGTTIDRLRLCDKLLTDSDGKQVREKIVYINPLFKRGKVVKFSLEPAHVYVAGHKELSWWKRLINRTFRRKIFKDEIGGIYCHNNKAESPD